MTVTLANTLVRPNRYAATCATCTGHVPAGAGSLTREAGAWVTRCTDPCEPVAPAAPVAQQEVTPGMYVDAQGEVWKVQAAQGSGNLYAKALTRIGGERLTEDDSVVRWEFTYAPGAMGVVRAATTRRMTLEEARAFGTRTGTCAVCAKHLKDAKSVAAGIGPVCIKRV